MARLRPEMECRASAPHCEFPTRKSVRSDTSGLPLLVFVSGALQDDRIRRRGHQEISKRARENFESWASVSRPRVRRYQAKVTGLERQARNIHDLKSPASS
jgi:hypothetical protein